MTSSVRMDASQEQTDVGSFAPLEPVADGFRNYYRIKHIMSESSAPANQDRLGRGRV